MHKCIHAVRYKSDTSLLAIVRTWSVLTRMIAFLSFSLRLFVAAVFFCSSSIIIIAYCFFRSANWYALLYEKVLFHCSLSYPPGRVFLRFSLFIFQYSFFFRIGLFKRMWSKRIIEALYDAVRLEICRHRSLLIVEQCKFSFDITNLKCLFLG